MAGEEVAEAVVEALARPRAAADFRHPLPLALPHQQRGPPHPRPGRVLPPHGRAQAQSLHDRAAQRPVPRDPAPPHPA